MPDESAVDVIFRFEHGLGKISLAHYLVPELPDARDIAETLGATDSLDKNLEYLLRRCVARLGALAEMSETAFGFSPSKSPPKSETCRNMIKSSFSCLISKNHTKAPEFPAENVYIRATDLSAPFRQTALDRNDKMVFCRSGSRQV